MISRKKLTLFANKYLQSLEEVTGKNRKGVYIRNCYYKTNKQTTYNEKFLRNIGIMAHIDAGKTTTTERMLYYSGITKFVGEVHDGNTVTDYMDQERERGITITSASISFPWKDHIVNLIDTPGHVDFTIEVERSLRILDGAVAVFDASAGVEAQSLTVWLQADRYNLPRLCYLNKMDKQSASLDYCIEDIKKKFNTKVLATQLPIGIGKSFDGIVDLVHMKKMKWCRNSIELGRKYESSPLTDADTELWRQSLEKRSHLVEEIADLDNSVAEVVLEKESTHLVPPEIIQQALKRITCKRLGVVVLMGSSYKNVGVQPLMDAILDYLPSPVDLEHPKVELYAPNLCAVAFKIIHHKKRGPMTFIRIYSGHLEQGQSIYNANKTSSEKIVKLFVAYADDFSEVKMADTGSIIVATGLKVTETGDTLVHSEVAVKKALKKLNEEGNSEKGVLVGVKIPDPVFMCSIEAPSLSQQSILDKALSCIQKEDPSLRVKVEEDTGQTVLAGMGELHLNIIKDRICKEYKIEAELGPLQISYREAIANYTKHNIKINKLIGDTKQEVNITLSLEPQLGYEIKKLELAYTKENIDNLQNIRKSSIDAITMGICSALMSGPILHFPVIDVYPKIHWLEVGRKTAESMISAAASQCIQEILKNNECHLLEPMMRIEIVVPEDRSSAILDELSRRRANIIHMDQRQSLKIIECICPLAELVGFTTVVRAISSGMANLSMEFSYHRQMTSEETSNTILAMSGYSYKRKL